MEYGIIDQLAYIRMQFRPGAPHGQSIFGQLGKQEQEVGMRELRTLREGWDAIEAEETRLLRHMTIRESVGQWLILQRSFEPQLQQTSAMFGPERRAALAHLQARLRCLVKKEKDHSQFG